VDVALDLIPGRREGPQLGDFLSAGRALQKRLSCGRAIAGLDVGLDLGRPLLAVVKARREQGWLVENEPTYPIGKTKCPQRDDRAVRVADQRNRLADRCDDGGEIFVLALDGVLGAVARTSPTTAIDSVEAQPPGQQGSAPDPVALISAAPVHQHGGRAFACLVPADLRPVPRGNHVESLWQSQPPRSSKP